MTCAAEDWELQSGGIGLWDRRKPRFVYGDLLGTETSKSIRVCGGEGSCWGGFRVLWTRGHPERSVSAQRLGKPLEVGRAHWAEETSGKWEDTTGQGGLRPGLNPSSRESLGAA